MLTCRLWTVYVGNVTWRLENWPRGLWRASRLGPKEGKGYGESPSDGKSGDAGGRKGLAGRRRGGKRELREMQKVLRGTKIGVCD